MVMKKRDGLVRSITVREKEGEIEKILLERYDRQGAYKGRTAIGFPQVNGGGGGGGGGGNVTNGPTPLAAAHTNTEEPSPTKTQSIDPTISQDGMAIYACVCAYVRMYVCVRVCACERCPSR